MKQDERLIIEDVIGRLDIARQTASTRANYVAGRAQPSAQSIINDVMKDLLEMVDDGKSKAVEPEPDEPAE